MLSDPQFWVAIAFVTFVIAIFNPVRKILSSSLDSKINEIKNKIKEAENLKNETQITLSDIKKRQNDVKKEIENIHINAKEIIQMLESEAQDKLKDQITKRNLSSSTRIEQMVRDANTSIQQYISQTAIESAVTLLKQKLNSEEKQNLINKSLRDLNAVLKN